MTHLSRIAAELCLFLGLSPANFRPFFTSLHNPVSYIHRNIQHSQHSTTLSPLCSVLCLNPGSNLTTTPPSNPSFTVPTFIFLMLRSSYPLYTTTYPFFQQHHLLISTCYHHQLGTNLSNLQYPFFITPANPHSVLVWFNF